MHPTRQLAVVFPGTAHSAHRTCASFARTYHDLLHQYLPYYTPYSFSSPIITGPKVPCNNFPASSPPRYTLPDEDLISQTIEQFVTLLNQLQWMDKEVPPEAHTAWIFLKRALQAKYANDSEEWSRKWPPRWCWRMWGHRWGRSEWAAVGLSEADKSSFRTRPTLSPPFASSPPLFDLAPAPSSPGYDFPMIRDSRRLPTTRQEPGAPHTRTVFVTTRRPPTGYDRSSGAWTTFPRFRSRTLSHTGRTYRVPDADPSDEADDIPTQPVPHFTRRIN
ncbi:hypothetical protein B0H14DRAFT_3512248 [Mycena olivaceomarginata]|nr:hypothetical protein B0H14DRAFT_3512248 [Mycena olivaceomarginata]